VLPGNFFWYTLKVGFVMDYMVHFKFSVIYLECIIFPYSICSFHLIYKSPYPNQFNYWHSAEPSSQRFTQPY
jgi:hypothetical protein